MPSVPSVLVTGNHLLGLPNWVTEPIRVMIWPSNAPTVYLLPAEVKACNHQAGRPPISSGQRPNWFYSKGTELASCTRSVVVLQKGSVASVLYRTSQCTDSEFHTVDALFRVAVLNVPCYELLLADALLFE